MRGANERSARAAKTDNESNASGHWDGDIGIAVARVWAGADGEPPPGFLENPVSVRVRLPVAVVEPPLGGNWRPLESVVWNVTLNGAAVPATTLTTRVLVSGSVIEVPAEIPQLVGCAVVPSGVAGRFPGQTSVTGPLKIASGTI
jgi:hypothetical protein